MTTKRTLAHLEADQAHLQALRAAAATASDPVAHARAILGAESAVTLTTNLLRANGSERGSM